MKCPNIGTLRLHFIQVMRDRRFNDKPWHFYFILKDLAGEGLVVANGDLWKRHRTIMLPTFNLSLLERFVDVFAEEAASFVHRMRTRQGREVEFEDELHKTAAYTVIRTTMSTSTNEAEDDIIRVGLRKQGRGGMPHAAFRFTLAQNILLPV